MGREGGLAVREGAGGAAPSQATTIPRAVLAIISDFLTWAEIGMALFHELDAEGSILDFLISN